jgi:hypothetical protein
VQARAIISFAFLVFLTVVVDFPHSLEPNLPSDWATLIVRFTDFVEYVFPGWLSQLLLAFLVVEAVVDLTGTRIGEADWIVWA